MKSIGVKFALIVGALVAALSLFLLVHTWTVTRSRLEEGVMRKADLAMEFNLAIRRYVAEEIRPPLEKQFGKHECPLELTSSSHIAREIFARVRKRFPEYLLKFSSDNPRNPLNRAEPEEMAILEHFRNHPEARDWRGQLTIGAQEYYVKAVPRRMEAECLGCHGRPEDAPRSLVARFGLEAGFHRTPGEVIAMDLVGVPTTRVRETIASEMTEQLAWTGIAVSATLGGILIAYRRLIGVRLARLAEHFRTATCSGVPPGDAPFASPAGDEIGSLAASFNAMAARLRADNDDLERYVAARTIDLRKEIDERRRTEEALRASEDRLRAVSHVAADAIVMTDAEGRVIHWNPAAERMFGYPGPEVLGRDVHELLAPPALQARSREAWSRFVRTGQGAAINRTTEFLAVRRGGPEFPVELSLSALPMSGGWGAVAVVRDITDRKRAELDLLAYTEALRSANQTLQELNRAAEAATRAKSEFLANMSHEIRTPVTAILGYAELLEETVADDVSRAHLATVRRNGQHLLQILNDILDLSKIEAGRVAVESVPCDPTEIVREVAAWMLPRAQQKGLTLATEQEGPLPRQVLCDPTRLRQIVTNLVGNAVKFTQQGSVRVAIRLETPAGGESVLAIEVADTGIGMSDEQLGRLFEPFTQGDESTTRQFGGSGLGLSISRRLARMLGGNIVARSAPGAGSTFRVTVPARPLDHVASPEAPTAEAARRPPETSRPASDGPKRALRGRILLAEDGADNLRLISLLLAKAGLEVTPAENGRIAVDLALKAWESGSPFDVILMDIQMPVLDGYGAVRELRQRGYPGPIVALTAHAMEEHRQRCLQAGCDDYLSKPIDRAGLLRTTERHLAPRRSRNASPALRVPPAHPPPPLGRTGG